jgi:negative regulator of flagellin synthesis FlgM
MTNKINGVDSRLGPVPAATPVGRGRSPATGEPVQDGADTGLRITESARQLAVLEKAIAALPVVDQARVDAVASALREGRYVVDPQRVADRLLRMDQDLAAARRKGS